MQRVTHGETQADVARAYNVDPAAIRTLVRNEARARQQLGGAVEHGSRAKRVSRRLKSTYLGRCRIALFLGKT